MPVVSATVVHARACRRPRPASLPHAPSLPTARHASPVWQVAANQAPIYGIGADGEAYLSEGDDAPYEEHCDVCQATPEGGGRWFKCVECINYDLCEGCVQSHSHPHRLVERGARLEDVQLLDAAWSSRLDRTKLSRSMECTEDGAMQRLGEMVSSVAPSRQAGVPRLKSATSLVPRGAEASRTLAATGVAKPVAPAGTGRARAKQSSKVDQPPSAAIEANAIQALAALATLRREDLLDREGWTTASSALSALAGTAQPGYTPGYTPGNAQGGAGGSAAGRDAPPFNYRPDLGYSLGNGALEVPSGPLRGRLPPRRAPPAAVARANRPPFPPSSPEPVAPRARVAVPVPTPLPCASFQALRGVHEPPVASAAELQPTVMQRALLGRPQAL